MATYDLSAASAIPGAGLNKIYVASKTIDFSKQNVASADVVKAFAIPAGTYVLGVYWKVVTAVGATCTAGVGDSAGATQFGTSVNLNSTATEDWSKLATGTPDTLGKLYTAASDIRLTMGNAATAGVVVLKAICVDLS